MLWCPQSGHHSILGFGFNYDHRLTAAINFSKDPYRNNLRNFGVLERQSFANYFRKSTQEKLAWLQAHSGRGRYHEDLADNGGSAHVSGDRHRL